MSHFPLCKHLGVYRGGDSFSCASERAALRVRNIAIDQKPSGFFEGLLLFLSTASVTASLAHRH